MSTASQPLAVPRQGIAALARDYAVLTKARVTTLIVMTAWAGAYFAAAKSGASSLSWTLLHALIGIGLVSGGTAAINEVVERDIDALMRRTSRRPLVTGSMSLLHASVIAFGMTIGGVLYLWATTNWLTAALAALTSITYLGVYTPMKRVHPICTFLGAFPGAMPPVLGWTAVRGRLDAEALVLVRHPLLLAVPALPLHRLALSRRLRERAHPHVARSGERRPLDRICHRDVCAGAGAGLARADADGHVGMDLLRRRAAAWHRHAVVQPAHVDDETRARCTRVENRAPATSLQASVIYLPLLFALMMINRAG